MVDSWIIYSIAALLLFGVVNFILKFVGGKIPTQLFVLFYFTAALATAIFIFLFKRVPIEFPGNTLYITIVAGIILGVAIFATATAFSLGLGSKVVTVINMNTVVTAILLIALLGERLTPKVGLGIGLAMVSLYLLTS